MGACAVHAGLYGHPGKRNEMGKGITHTGEAPMQFLLEVAHVRHHLLECAPAPHGAA